VFFFLEKRYTQRTDKCDRDRDRDDGYNIPYNIERGDMVRCIVDGWGKKNHKKKKMYINSVQHRTKGYGLRIVDGWNKKKKGKR